MKKKKIITYQKHFGNEKRENKFKNNNEKKITFNVPKMKKYQEIQIKLKTSNKNFPKSISVEKIQSNKDKENGKKEIYFKKEINMPKSHFTKHQNINNNYNNKKINENYINKKIISNNIKNDNLNIESSNKIFHYNLNKKENTNDENNISNYNIINNDDFIIDKNNLINKNNEKNEETPKKLRSDSFEKINLTYSKFINNLKLQMGNFEEIEKNRNKNTKNIFSRFLNQFINKDERNETSINNSRASFNNINNINNKKNTYKNYKSFKNVLMNSSIHFFIEGISNNSQKDEQINKEIVNIQKELNIKQNKINELLKIIENQNLEFNQLQKNYNNIAIENNKLKEEINIKDIENNKLKEEINNKEIQNNKLKEEITIKAIENNKLKEKINNNINKNPDKNSILNSEFENKENLKYNNLITYNINKNNNYNIINSEINNINNIIENNNLEEPLDKNIKNNEDSISLKEKEIIKNENEVDKKRERKASHAFERFKKVNKIYNINKGEEIKKSEKIYNLAKNLENQIGGVETKERKTTINIYKIDINKNDDTINDYSNNIINLIASQPIINNKKKKSRSLNFQI